MIIANLQQSSVTLEEIEGANDFIQRFEKIEPPNQLVAVIGDPLLQKFLQLQSSDIYDQRLDNWLLSFFEGQLQAAEPSEVKILEILKGIIEYTNFTKVRLYQANQLGFFSNSFPDFATSVFHISQVYGTYLEWYFRSRNHP